MSVSTHLKPGLTDKSRVKIMTVDVANRRIEAGIKDGSMIQVAVWEVPEAFRWPIEGEMWIVRRDNGIWMLDKRVQQAQSETLPITSMSPGQMKLDSTAIFDSQGHQLLAVTAQGLSGHMVAGAVTIDTTKVTTSSHLYVSRQGGTNPGAVFEFSRTPGVSFTVHSTNASDTGQVAYLLI